MKTISADIKTDVTRNKKAGSCVFTEVPSQNLKFNVKQACIFHLILVGISCSLILSIKNGEDGGGGSEGYLTTKIC